MNRTYRVCTLRGTKGKVEETVRALTEQGLVDAAWTIRVEPEETQPYTAVEIVADDAPGVPGVRLLASYLAAMFGYKSFLGLFGERRVRVMVTEQGRTTAVFFIGEGEWLRQMVRLPE